MLGFKGPASMANLSDQEIDDIIVYMRSHEREAIRRNYAMAMHIPGGLDQ
jgi:hypothetical protein